MKNNITSILFIAPSCPYEKGFTLDEEGKCRCPLERGYYVDENGNCKLCPVEDGFILTEDGMCICDQEKGYIPLKSGVCGCPVPMVKNDQGVCVCKCFITSSIFLF